MKEDLLEKIEHAMPDFSKGQRAISRFVISSYHKAAYMTAARLGKEVGVSESTVVRYAIELGYEGYPEFQSALQEVARTRLTTLQRMEIAKDRMSQSEVLTKVLTSDADRIHDALLSVSGKSFDAALDALVGAENIYIAGVRTSSILAEFMYLYFGLIFDHVKLVTNSFSSEIFEQLTHIGKGDVLVAISFPRYSKKMMGAVNYAKTTGAKVISITDSETAPIAAAADYLLTAKSEMASFVDSLVAPMSLINALIVGVGKRKETDLSAIFAKLERMWDEYHVYETADRSPS